jgi:hypothetical protein
VSEQVTRPFYDEQPEVAAEYGQQFAIDQEIAETEQIHAQVIDDSAEAEALQQVHEVLSDVEFARELGRMSVDLRNTRLRAEQYGIGHAPTILDDEPARVNQDDWTLVS